MKKYDQAIHHLTIAVGLNPNLVPGHVSLAATYSKTEDWEKAAEHYRKVLQLSPRMAAYAHYGLGNVQARQLHHADAVASYRRAIALGANNAQTFTQLARSCSP